MSEPDARTTHRVATPTNTTLRRTVAGASIGSIIEWYDNGIYAYLAAVMGKVFFPTDSTLVQLLSSFAAFAVAFLVRPIGGTYFGTIGDRIGRQRTLAYMIVIMSSATFLIGVLPGYATLGIAAPILLVLLRLIQGFSAGGELTGAAIFVGETAPPPKRASYVSFVQSGGNAGFLLGTAVVLALTLVVSDGQVSHWGWRIPFLAAGPLGAIGLLIRSHLEETPEFKLLQRTQRVASAPLRRTVADAKGAVLIAIAYSLFHNVALYVIVTYLPSHLQDQLHFSSTTSSASSLVTMILMCLVIPLFGRLSDRVGRRPVLGAACIAAILFGYPLFAVMGISTVTAFITQASLGIILAAFLGATLTALQEHFSAADRFTGLSLGYNISVSLFGGTAPFFMVLLVSGLHSSAAPGLYIIVAAAVALIAVWRSRETVGIASETQVTPHYD